MEGNLHAFLKSAPNGSEQSAMVNLGRENRSPDRDLNPETSVHEAELWREFRY